MLAHFMCAKPFEPNGPKTLDMSLYVETTDVSTTQRLSCYFAFSNKSNII